MRGTVISNAAPCWSVALIPVRPGAGAQEERKQVVEDTKKAVDSFEAFSKRWIKERLMTKSETYRAQIEPKNSNWHRQTSPSRCRSGRFRQTVGHPFATAPQLQKSTEKPRHCLL